LSALRLFLVAVAAGGLGFDLAKKGRQEFEVRAKISQIAGEMEIVSRHRANLQVGIQRRVISRIARSTVTCQREVEFLELGARPTSWERPLRVRSSVQNAYADEAETPMKRLPLSTWIGRR